VPNLREMPIFSEERPPHESSNMKHRWLPMLKSSHYRKLSPTKHELPDTEAFWIICNYWTDTKINITTKELRCECSFSLAICISDTSYASSALPLKNVK